MAVVRRLARLATPLTRTGFRTLPHTLSKRAFGSFDDQEGFLEKCQASTKRAQAGLIQAYHTNRQMFYLVASPVIIFSMLDPSLLLMNAVLFYGVHSFNKIPYKSLHDFGVKCREQYGPKGEHLALGLPFAALTLLSPAFASFVLPFVLFFGIRRVLLDSGAFKGGNFANYQQGSTAKLPEWRKMNWGDSKSPTPTKTPETPDWADMTKVVDKIKNMFKK